MRRTIRRMSLVAVAVTMAVAVMSGVAATPAHAGVYGVYPSADACHAVGQMYTGVLWNYYTCYPAQGGWALWAPGI